jgi:hypothetical protein
VVTDTAPLQGERANKPCSRLLMPVFTEWRLDAMEDLVHQQQNIFCVEKIKKSCHLKKEFFFWLGIEAKVSVGHPPSSRLQISWEILMNHHDACSPCAQEAQATQLCHQFLSLRAFIIDSPANSNRIVSPGLFQQCMYQRTGRVR